MAEIPWSYALLLVYFIPVFTVGMLGNLWVLSSVFHILQKARSPLNYTFRHMALYILSLSIADIAVLLCCPLLLSYFLGGHWPFGLLGCKLFFAMENINKLLSVAILAVMSFERFVAVSRPFRWWCCCKLRPKRAGASVGLVVLGLLATIVLLCSPMIFWAELKPLQISFDDGGGSDNGGIGEHGDYRGISEHGEHEESISDNGHNGDYKHIDDNDVQHGDNRDLGDHKRIGDNRELGEHASVGDSGEHGTLGDNRDAGDHRNLGDNGSDRDHHREYIGDNWDFGEFGTDPMMVVCSSNLPDQVMSLFIGYMFLLGFVLPLLFICCCYFFLIQHVRHTRDNFESWPRGQQGMLVSACTAKVVRSVLGVVGFHIVCWAPFWISVLIPFVEYFHLIRVPPSLDQFSRKIRMASSLLPYLNSAGNWVFYAAMNRELRDAVSVLWSSNQQQQQNTSVSLHSSRVQQPAALNKLLRPLLRPMSGRRRCISSESQRPIALRELNAGSRQNRPLDRTESRHTDIL